MNEKYEIDSQREVIDEQDVIDNLVDENGQSYNDTRSSSHRVIYAKHRGCFDGRSMFINLIIYTIVLLVTSGFFEGFSIASIGAAFYTAIVMSILNVFLKPILVFVTLPLTIMTFGLFYVVVNAILLWIADGIMGPYFEIRSFTTAIVASIFISLLRMGINRYILKENNFKIDL